MPFGYAYNIIIYAFCKDASKMVLLVHKHNYGHI